MTEPWWSLATVGNILTYFKPSGGKGYFLNQCA